MTKRAFRSGALYLTRRYLWPWGRIRVYLHTLHRSDDTPHFHNHPWAWGWSLILWGGYVEERLANVGDTPRRVITSRTLRPGSAYMLRPGDFHRVTGIDRPSWSLFIAGPKLARPPGKEWGFKCPTCGTYTPHGQFNTTGARCGHP